MLRRCGKKAATCVALGRRNVSREGPKRVQSLSARVEAQIEENRQTGERIAAENAAGGVAEALAAAAAPHAAFSLSGVYAALPTPLADAASAAAAERLHVDVHEAALRGLVRELLEPVEGAEGSGSVAPPPTGLHVLGSVGEGQFLRPHQRAQVLRAVHEEAAAVARRGSGAPATVLWAGVPAALGTADALDLVAEARAVGYDGVVLEIGRPAFEHAVGFGSREALMHLTAVADLAKTPILLHVEPDFLDHGLLQHMVANRWVAGVVDASPDGRWQLALTALAKRLRPELVLVAGRGSGYMSSLLVSHDASVLSPACALFPTQYAMIREAFRQGALQIALGIQQSIGPAAEFLEHRGVSAIKAAIDLQRLGAEVKESDRPRSMGFAAPPSMPLGQEEMEELGAVLEFAAQQLQHVEQTMQHASAAAGKILNATE